MTMPKPVYVAGPLFSEAERAFLLRIVDVLSQASGLDPVTDFYLPHRDGGDLGRGPGREELFRGDVENIEAAKVVVALLDGQDADSGTCIELGYAYARGKKVLGLLTDFRADCTVDIEPHRPNLMVWGVCERGGTIFRDLGSLAEAFAAYAAEAGLR